MKSVATRGISTPRTRVAGVSQALLPATLAGGADAAAVGGSLKTSVKGRRKVSKVNVIRYRRSTGVDAYVRALRSATPMEMVEIERRGVPGLFIKDLARRMDIATSRLFSILGVPKTTAERKVAAGQWVTGSAGYAALGMVKLLGMAQDMVENSKAPEAKNFDAAKWLGQWIEQPLPAFGGRKPADLLDTPTGIEMVARLLGAIESGAYQ